MNIYIFVNALCNYYCLLLKGGDHIYPTPPLGQDMTQSQFLKGGDGIVTVGACKLTKNNYHLHKYARGVVVIVVGK